MRELAQTNRGVHLWRTAKALNLPPGEVADRLAHGDPQAHFAHAAVAEDERRMGERWEGLAKIVKNGFEALQKTMRKAFSR